jgi:hypothetical protein
LEVGHIILTIIIIIIYYYHYYYYYSLSSRSVRTCLCCAPVTAMCVSVLCDIPTLEVVLAWPLWQISDAEYTYYMDSEVSTYKCAECVKLLRVHRNDDTSVKTRSASASDVPRRISPGPRLCIVFRNMEIFYGEELLAPRPTPKL